MYSISCTMQRKEATMGKVGFLDPVDFISGKISRKYRTCYNYRRWSDRRYTSVHGDRLTPESVNELAVRERFSSTKSCTKSFNGSVTSDL